MNIESENYPYEFQFADIFGIAFKMFKQYYNDIFKIIFYVAFPINAITILAFPIGKPIFNPETFQIEGLNIMNFGITIFLSLFTLISSIALIKYLHFKINNEEPMNLLETFKSALSLFPRIIIAHLAFSGMLGLGTMMFILPGAIIASTFLFGYYAICVREMGIIDAFDYSSKLTKGRRLTVFTSVITLLLISVLISFIFSLISSLFDNDIFTVVITTLLNVIGSYYLVFLYVMFINLEDTFQLRNPEFMNMSR